MSAYTDKSRLFFLNLPHFSRQIHVQYSIVLFSRQVEKEVSVLDTPSSVSVHECSANPDILNHDARLNDVSPNDASPNDVSCPSCSPHRTGYSSVTPETNLFPDSHGLLSVHFPPARMPIPLKHPNRNCFRCSIFSTRNESQYCCTDKYGNYCLLHFSTFFPGASFSPEH